MKKKIVSFFMIFWVITCIGCGESTIDEPAEDPTVEQNLAVTEESIVTNVPIDSEIQTTPDAEITPVTEITLTEEPVPTEEPEENKKEVYVPSVGDIVPFGKYEQDNSTGNGAETIEWIILDVEGKSALLLSKYCLDVKRFHEGVEKAAVTWKDSTLREWLNSQFLETAFTEDERSYILTTVVSDTANAGYGTDGGAITEDKVFLLSVEEADKYFPESVWSEEEKYDINRERATQATSYAHMFAWRPAKKDRWWSDNCYWWLRSTGTHQVHGVRFSYGVSFAGNLSRTNIETVDRNGGVRPAIWISWE